MSIKSIILGAATLASVALPGVASAQSYGYYGGGNGYYASGRDQGYHQGNDRRYDARDRREEHRRRKEIERQRRWEWQHRHHGRNDHYNDGYRY